MAGGRFDVAAAGLLEVVMVPVWVVGRAVGVADGVATADSVAVVEGVADAEAEGDAVGEGEPVADPVSEALGLADAVGDAVLVGAESVGVGPAGDGDAAPTFTCALAA